MQRHFSFDDRAQYGACSPNAFSVPVACEDDLAEVATIHALDEA